MTESDIQRQIMALLTARGVFHWRNQATNVGRRANVQTRGVSDLIALPKGAHPFTPAQEKNQRDMLMKSSREHLVDIIMYQTRLMAERQPALFIEVKAPGGKQSKFQLDFEQKVCDSGHVYIVAHSVEDVEEALRGMGK